MKYHEKHDKAQTLVNLYEEVIQKFIYLFLKDLKELPNTYCEIFFYYHG